MAEMYEVKPLPVYEIPLPTEPLPSTSKTCPGIEQEPMDTQEMVEVKPQALARVEDKENAKTFADKTHRLREVKMEPTSINEVTEPAPVVNPGLTIPNRTFEQEMNTEATSVSEPMPAEPVEIKPTVYPTTEASSANEPMSVEPVEYQPTAIATPIGAQSIITKASSAPEPVETKPTVIPTASVTQDTITKDTNTEHLSAEPVEVKLSAIPTVKVSDVSPDRQVAKELMSDLLANISASPKANEILAAIVPMPESKPIVDMEEQKPSAISTPVSKNRRRTFTKDKAPEVSENDEAPLITFVTPKTELTETTRVLRKRRATVDPKANENKENSPAVSSKRSKLASTVNSGILKSAQNTPKTPRTPRVQKKTPVAKKSSAKKVTAPITPKSEPVTPKAATVTTPKLVDYSESENSEEEFVIIDEKKGRRNSSPTHFKSDHETEDSSSCEDSEEEFVPEKKGRRRSSFRTRNVKAECYSDDEGSPVRPQTSSAKKTRKIQVKKEITVGEAYDNSMLVQDDARKNFCMECNDFTHKAGEKNQGARRHIFTKHLDVHLYHCVHCNHSSPHDRYHIRLHSRRIHNDFSGRVRCTEKENEDKIRYWMEKCFGVEGTSARSPDTSINARRRRRVIKKEKKEIKSDFEDTDMPTLSPAVPVDAVDDTAAPFSDYDSDESDLGPDSPGGPILCSWEDLMNDSFQLEPELMELALS